MKNISLLFIITLFTVVAYGHPKQAGSQPKTSAVDSVLFYFNKSKTAAGIDSLVFQQGIRILNRIPVDDNSIKRIEQAAEDFKGIHRSEYSNDIKLAIIIAYSNAHEHYKEIDYGKAIINRYDADPNPDDRNLFLNALSFLRVPFRVSDKLDEGFDFYTAKLKLYLQRNDSAAISLCYYVHGGFYRTKGLYDLSIYYFKKSISYLNENDTLIGKEVVSGRRGWKNNTGVVGNTYNDLGDYRNAILYSRSALKYGIKTKADSSPVSYVYKNIAYAKMMLNEHDSVTYFLTEAVKYTENPSDIAIVYQIMGMYYLKLNQLDSAEFYLQGSANRMAQYRLNANSTRGILNPNYYLAQIRLKQHRFTDAVELLKYEIPQVVNLREELMNDYKLLMEVYLKLGDAKKAHETFFQYTTLQQKLVDDERHSRKLSFETEEKITAAEYTITNLTNETKIASLSRNYMIGIASLLLLIALGLFNRFRITRKQKAIIEKEKQRSDMLLLNILPAEVAEELKTKGSADAKQFDEVTVMFTDFKGFTQISERLSPTDLVDEINTCFKAFDAIITKHNLEKIKTIGDSYMCAGGLPVANKTHAHDMVKAALEIQQFMCEHIQTRTSENKEIFEIRIGIHTGTVVAGIVGIKKFAYDIWGDTVNIASRMESSGEAGKVNISGSTYELVKAFFSCEHRGKIQAKNKGEVDMYFVNRSLSEG